MTVRYDKDRDTLTVGLKPESYETFEFEGGDFTVVADEDDSLIKITIANASRFIAQALAAGVKVEVSPVAQPKQSGMVWYDADSSMISAFGYDETERILEIAFHNTGVYRYFDVPPEVFEGLRDASSKGSYVRNMIIDTYSYEKKRGRSRR
jgi:uncharacterized protein YuzE